jgi:hypothetical protein
MISVAYFIDWYRIVLKGSSISCGTPTVSSSAQLWLEGHTIGRVPKAESYCRRAGSVRHGPYISRLESLEAAWEIESHWKNLDGIDL